MVLVHRAALLAALVVASTPATVEGQQQAYDSLARRIVVLQNILADLEQRVRALEDHLVAGPPQAQGLPAPANWRERSNWRRLHLGMTPDEVRAVLGEPDRVRASTILRWSWGDPDSAQVEFLDEKLMGWEEPPRQPAREAAPVLAETYLEAQVDDPPVMITAGPRSYPSVLQRAGIGGRVMLQFVVDASGHPEATGLLILSSTNSAFNEPAREMIMQSVFRPGRVRGRPVRVQMQQAVSFTP